MRAAVESQLDHAVRDNRVVLVHGLPRVGRTQMLRRWANGRDDVFFRPSDGPQPEYAPVLAIDHFAKDQVSDFIAEMRAADDAKEATRYVLAPTDLQTFQTLQNALVGSVQPLEVVPLQLDEYLAQQMPLAQPAGPQAQAQPEAEATGATGNGLDTHWLRGGLPESLSFESLAASLTWRRAMIEGLLGRDYSDFRVTAASRLPELLRWIANQNAGEFDEESCQLTKKPDLRSAIYVLERIGLVRRLSNYPVGSNLSMLSMPKLYIRDSGLLHALLGIESIGQLRSHRSAGDSWEGYAAEALIEASRGMAAVQFYRAKGPEMEDEIDLVLDFLERGGPILAIEFKLNPNEGPRPGYYRARAIVGATAGFVVHSGDNSRTDTEVERLTLIAAIQRVRQISESLG